MSLCDVCISPGACCKAFTLSVLPSWVGEGLGAPLRQMAEYGLPFLPLYALSTYRDAATGADYQVWVFRCTNILSNGRCGDYENRPELCRSYQPRQDALCAMSATRLLPREVKA